MFIEKISDGYHVFDALASKLRLAIVELLLVHHEMALNDIATKLDISQSTLTPHIKKLEKAGLINLRAALQSRGSTKYCKLTEDKIVVNIIPNEPEQKFFETDLDVGTYFDYSVLPTCGLASVEKVIGNFDDPRFFADPERFNAGIIWFSQGYVSYKIPNMLTTDATPVEMQISLELCSEAPGTASNYPSDIYFSVNNLKLGYWTSPGELFDRPGRLTPHWWFPNFPKYGRIKVITINETGSYLDGLFLSSVRIQDLDLKTTPEITFKIEIPVNAKHVGGINLFGKGFGDYDTGIKIKLLYK